MFDKTYHEDYTVYLQPLATMVGETLSRYCRNAQPEQGHKPAKWNEWTRLRDGVAPQTYLQCEALFAAIKQMGIPACREDWDAMHYRALSPRNFHDRDVWMRDLIAKWRVHLQPDHLAKAVPTMCRDYGRRVIVYDGRIPPTAWRISHGGLYEL